MVGYIWAWGQLIYKSALSRKSRSLDSDGPNSQQRKNWCLPPVLSLLCCLSKFLGVVMASGALPIPQSQPIRPYLYRLFFPPPCSRFHHRVGFKHMLWIRIRILIGFGWLDLDPHWECGSGSGSRWPKKIYKAVEMYCFELLMFYFEGWRHGLINYIDTKAKCRHRKKLTCKGTLRQVFIRVYRL